MNHFTKFLIISCILFVTILTNQPPAEALWLYQDVQQQQQQQPQLQVPDQQQIAQPEVTASSSDQQLQLQQEPLQQQQQQQHQQQTNTDSTYQNSNYASRIPGSALATNILSIAGIQPSRIASLLNTVGETGFAYFNIHDQCRNRAACDLGHMLYKKLSFVHNWLIRTSVRTLTDMNNIYTQSWMEGMLGRNCSAIYLTCRQSPLEGLMSMTYLQHLTS